MPNRVIIKGKIGNALESQAEDHILGVANDIFDENMQMYQSEINQNSGVFDISVYHATGDPLTPATYADLAAALDSEHGGGVPENIRKGGMTVKFVRTSDNKYVQSRCMAQNFTTDVTQWQGVDDEPTAGSDNIVKSGGVYSNTPTNTDGRNDVDLEITDEYNLPVVVFEQGHIKTKNFDSSKDATTEGRGLMSAEDKAALNESVEKLSTIEEGAEVNDVEIDNTADGDLEFSDEHDNVVMRLANGHIKTKEFDSSEVIKISISGKKIIIN